MHFLKVKREQEKICISNQIVTFLFYLFLQTTREETIFNLLVRVRQYGESIKM